MPLSTQTLAQLQALYFTQYGSQAAQPANTDAGSTMGAIGNAQSLLAMIVQNELVYVDANQRLATIQDPLPDGTPNPNIDSFVNPFGFYRNGPTAASGLVTCSTPSPVSQQVVVPVGGILTTKSGLKFDIIAGGAAYSATLNGYPINPGQSSVQVLVDCEDTGTIGNVAAGAINVIYGSTGAPFPSAVQTVSNASAFTNGVNVETGPALKQRFMLFMSGKVVATGNAVLAAALATQAGLTISNGDRVNADLSTHAAYFTIVAAQLGTGTAPSQALINAISAGVNSVRAEGISYQVIAPTLQPVNVAGTVLYQPGYDSTILPNLNSAVQTYLNNIGVNADTTPTRASIGKLYGVALGVTGVYDIPSLTLNGGSIDLTTPFANMFVAGTVNFTSA